jgi:ubiquinone/menaquinone biosynthesis C-methylase UbiE
MAANFNNAAWFYDRLSRLVYGGALIKAQVFLLRFIPANSKILIVGGGTGWILEEIAKLHLSGLKITYVEVSLNMMKLSKKKHVGKNEVVFVNDKVEDVSLTGDFDVVVTPFLFDNFTEQTLKKVFNHLHALLKPNGLWLNASFQYAGKWWQPLLLKSMFLFFRMICGIEASELPEIETIFHQHNYWIVSQRHYYDKFIVSKVYKTM